MELKEYIKEKQDRGGVKQQDFVSYLYSLMDKYKIEKNSTLYTRANISKQVFSNMISGKANPSLNNCLKIAFCLNITNQECKYLLKKAGYTLPSCSTYSCIVRYCIENKIYDLDTLNNYLIEYGYTNSLIE